jgi:hypothetical protein
MDIARYAKVKGSGWHNSHDIRACANANLAIAKDFEVLDAPRRVIALDEDVFMNGPQSRFLDDDSDWEDIDGFAEVDSDAGMSEQDCEADYLLARRLQDEEDALQAHRRGVSGTRRRAYADVLAAANG